MTCKHCHSNDPINVLEIFIEDHDCQLDFCCESFQRDFMYEGADLGEELKGLTSGAGYQLRAISDNRLNFKIEVREISFASAKSFIDTNHRHNKAPVGWKFGLAAYNGETLVAIATCGRPVARAYNNQPILEVNRLCVDPTLNPWLVYNACSKLYAACARACKKMGIKKVITYTRADENGASLKASNFKEEAFVRGRAYKRNGVVRGHLEVMDKTRWAINF